MDRNTQMIEHPTAHRHAHTFVFVWMGVHAHVHECIDEEHH